MSQDSITILIVDDRPENLLALEKLLKAPGLVIMKAASGNEALALALDHEFALVLMDVQMPGMDGFETAELMRSADRMRHTPIIFVTAISKEQKHVFKGYEAGAVDYLFKPIDPDILLSKVTIFLDLYRQKAALFRANEQLAQVNRQVLEQQTAVIEEERLKVLLQMAGATAHELNQPLTLLLGSIDLMDLDKGNPDALFMHAKNIKRAGEKIAEIVKRIQTIRRYETKQQFKDVHLVHFDQKIKVLSIEDSLPDFEAIRMLLAEEASVTLNHVPTLQAASQALERDTYDLILMDHVLPDGTGEDFLKRASEKGLETPFIVVTGQGDEILASRMIRDGASGYLPKNGLNRTTLIREMHQAVEKAHLQSEVRRAHQKLAELSAKDDLTGLYNRRYFNEALAGEFSRAERYKTAFSLCILDLDHFKVVNDSYGHPAGDTVLKETARLLISGFRKADIVCRYGGEEFAVILHQAGAEEARRACETFRKTLEAHPFVHNDTLIRMTVSIGIHSCARVSCKSPEELTRQADLALYKAKNGGRNRIEVQP